MSSNDEPKNRQIRPPTSDAPSNSKLAERMARVEAGLEHVDTKLDHHGETLDRIADNLDSQLDETAEEVEEIKPQHKRLWLTHQALKWFVGVSAGGTLTVYLLTTII